MIPTVSPEPKSRRRLGWWILLGLGLFLTPFALLGVGILSMIRLDHDAAVLKSEVMAASDADWHTKVQVSAGWMTLGTVRTALRFIEHEHMDEARLALRAVRRASVGVYECYGRKAPIADGQLLKRIDESMRRRGWSRLVGVAEGRETVMVYASDDISSGNRIDLCIAVIDGNELVVVSTNVDAAPLTELVAMHLPKDGLRAELKRKAPSF